MIRTVELRRMPFCINYLWNMVAWSLLNTRSCLSSLILVMPQCFVIVNCLNMLPCSLPVTYIYWFWFSPLFFWLAVNTPDFGLDVEDYLVGKNIYYMGTSGAPFEWSPSIIIFMHSGQNIHWMNFGVFSPFPVHVIASDVDWHVTFILIITLPWVWMLH